ncbi:taste receptor type 2 member 113-like [Octodon degus]|uniref:Taste receptor type 2 member 113-like n=1 Tax=Octodon degus TaxID=10160 RepID=A0A6P6DYW9_OCTDE|nr:taste receptor type 2 member 113-like [Octodon degus]
MSMFVQIMSLVISHVEFITGNFGNASITMANFMQQYICILTQYCIPDNFSLLIFSLWKHLKRMQESVRESRNISTTAHIKALHIIVTFLLLHIIISLFFGIRVS